MARGRAVDRSELALEMGLRGGLVRWSKQDVYGSIARKHNLLVIGTTDARSRLRLYDLLGRKRLRSFTASVLSECREISGVALDDSLHVYVTNRLDHRVHVFTPFGREVARFGGVADRRSDGRRALQGPNAIAAHDMGLIFVACGDRPLVHAVQIFDLAGRHRGRLRAFGENEETFSGPQGIRAEGERVYVADTGNGCIQTFSIRGTFMSVLSTATHPGERSRPVDVLPIPRERGGGMLIAQVGEESAIKEFDREGQFVRLWASTGEGSGEVLDPASMAWDARGRLLVLDELGRRLQCFDDGEFVEAILDERTDESSGDHEASSRR